MIPRLRPGLSQGDIMAPAENRAYYRRTGHSDRQRLPGVAIPPERQPWKSHDA